MTQEDSHSFPLSWKVYVTDMCVIACLCAVYLRLVCGLQVLAQLAEISEEDVFEEMEQLLSTDLSNVEYMPAYLNKRLNNRLWSRRKLAAACGH